MKIYKAVAMIAAFGVVAGAVLADSGASGGKGQTVTIHGISRASCQNNLKQIALASHSATIYVGSANGGVWKTTNGGQLIPRIVIEGKGGVQVAFMDASVREISRGSEPDVLKITLDFKSTTATPQLVEALLAGR